MKSFFKKEKVLIVNNLWSFAIHVVVAVLSVMGMIIAGVIFGSFTAGGIGALVPVVGYVILGYFLLTPRAKGNFLSVVGLAVLMVMIFGYLHFVSMLVSDDGSAMLMAFNFPAMHLTVAMFIALASVTDLLGIALSDDTVSTMTLLTSAFIPSLLIYLGLRLKMWREAKIAATDLEPSDE